MTSTQRTYATLGLGILSIAVLFTLFAFGVQAAAPSGLSATVATTSIPTVTNAASLVFASTTGGNCAARTISTASSSIMLGFSDRQGFVPTALKGIYQAASTTITYDGGQFGCDAVRIFSFQQQMLTVMESR